MISPRKYLKKLAMTTALAGCLFGSLASSAFAAVDASSLNNRVGNELQATFNVTEEYDAEDTVVISWDAAGLNLNLENYDLTKNEAKTITYYVSPGAENDDDLTVSVLLRVPLSSEAYMDSLKVDGNLTQNSFVDGDEMYFVLKEGLGVEVGAMAYTGSFDITFHTASADVPFYASLIAVTAGGLNPAPSFYNQGADYSDGQIEEITYTADYDLPLEYYQNLTVYYSKDGGVTYVKGVAGQEIYMDPISGMLVFSGNMVPGYDDNGMVQYKLVSPGYEDAFLYFAEI